MYLPHLITNYTPVLRPKPVPDLETAHDEPLVCVEFSAALVPYLLGLLEIYRWPDRFRGSAEDKERGTAIFAELMCILSEAGMCCCDETNEQIRQLRIIQNISYNQQLNQQYDGTPQSIGATLPTNFDGDATTDYGDNRLDVALCKAVNDMLAAGITQAASDLNEVNAAAGFLTGILGLINPVAGIIVGVTWAFTQQQLSNAMGDENAFKKVACCILSGLRGVEISQQALANATANSGCSFDDNAAVINSIWESLFVGGNENYLAFLAHHDRALRNTQEGEDSDCECCGISDDLRLDYKWFYEDGDYEQTREMSMSRTGNLITIIPYRQTYNMDTDIEIGFRLYSPTECCIRMRFVTPDFLTIGAGNFYPPVGQRQGDPVGCPPADEFTTPTAWFCAKELMWRWAVTSASYPAWLDDGITIEIDPDFPC